MCQALCQAWRHCFPCFIDVEELFRQKNVPFYPPCCLTQVLIQASPPGKKTGVGCHALFQGIFSTQGSNPHLSLSIALAGRIFTPSATWKAPVNADN